MIAGDAPNETTQRVAQTIVENERLHGRLRDKMTGRDPEGEESEVYDYLRDSAQAGDPWLLAALTGRSAFDDITPAEGDERLAEVDTAYVAAFLKTYPRAV